MAGNGTRRTPGSDWSTSSRQELCGGKDIEYAVTAGTIKNSEFGQTIFAGGCVTKPILKWSSGRISVSAFVGALNYPSKFNLQQKAGDIIPAILPTLTVCFGETLLLRRHVYTQGSTKPRERGGALRCQHQRIAISLRRCVWDRGARTCFVRLLTFYLIRNLAWVGEDDFGVALIRRDGAADGNALVVVAGEVAEL
jgi:hypothetical protein